MPSPFPGMDPFIEAQQHWSDFHADMATEIRADLNKVIRPGYYARAVTYVAYDVIEVSQPEPRASYPDIGVWRTSHDSPGSAMTAVIDPPQAQGIVQIETSLRLANVEIRATGTNRLITAIEILSPINKRPGREREKYLRKRTELMRSDVHVIEIDLLRGGQRTPLETPLPPAPYYVTLSRENRRPYVEIWTISLQKRLPVIAVPLNKPDPDAPLDLGAVVREVYERGGYDVSIDYRQPVPPPPLEEHDQAFVNQLLQPYQESK